MAAQMTPREFAEKAFEFDTRVMHHLLFREQEDIDESTITIEMKSIAEEVIANGSAPVFDTYDAGKIVLALYALDENKLNVIELLEGVN